MLILKFKECVYIALTWCIFWTLSLWLERCGVHDRAVWQALPMHGPRQCPVLRLVLLCWPGLQSQRWSDGLWGRWAGHLFSLWWPPLHHLRRQGLQLPGRLQLHTGKDVWPHACPVYRDNPQRELGASHLVGIELCGPYGGWSAHCHDDGQKSLCKLVSQLNLLLGDFILKLAVSLLCICRYLIHNPFGISIISVIIQLCHAKANNEIHEYLTTVELHNTLYTS